MAYASLVLGTQRSLRSLGPGDLLEVTRLLARDPVVNVVADYRARSTQLQTRLLGGEMWGFYADGELVSLCHAAANLIPVMATPEAIDAFAAKALHQGRRCSTIVGEQDQVELLWDRLSGHWSVPRDIRRGQPHLEMDRPSALVPDPGVRRTRTDELDLVYPAAVAMYTEEVGVSPEAGGGGATYRARIQQLIARGWSYVRVENGRVVFKAEIAAVSPYACQVQGVYVVPDLRGSGLGTAGMAAVVDLALREVAPVVALYVNEHNVAARRVYERVGFRETRTFSTVLF